jgi:exopolysaccharide production protein ExoQ
MGRLIGPVICALVIWQLFRLNREKDVRTSIALWIPTFWLFIACSRNVSEWLHFSSGGSDRYLEGNPLDRAVLSLVLVVGVAVLLSRARRVGKLLQSNFPIVLYFLYCGISVLWSEFADVAFKRWFRALGDVVMVLIVLSEPDWPVALRRLFARVGFVLVPLSILFIRYFPEYGRSFTHAGAPTWTGVTTDKNALGMLCLLFGLAFIFRFLQVYRGEENSRTKGILIAHGVLIVMTFYLLWEANSVTAFSCFFLAGVPMVLIDLFRWGRKPAAVHAMVVASLGISFSALFLNIGTGLVEGMGRNATLTGRTAVWRSALSLVQNPVLGTGFESFWLGPHLKQMMVLINQGANQAHNGYIEVYLNLGWIGVALLAVFLISGYRRITTAVRRMTPAASLRLAFFIVAVAYNFTEAGFKMMHPVWIALLLAAMVVPEAISLADSSPIAHTRVGDFTELKREEVKSYVDSRLQGASLRGDHRGELRPIRRE